MKKIKQVLNNLNILELSTILLFFCVAVRIIYSFIEYIYFHPNVHNNHPVLLFLFLTTYIGIAGYLWLLVYNVKKIKAEIFFIISYIILGTLYLLLFMPWSTPDAGVHFIASYRYSNILEGSLGWIGRFDDISFFNKSIIKEINSIYRNNYSHNYEDLFTHLKFFSENSEIIEFGHQAEKMKFYSFICYLPQILGLLLGRILNFSGLVTCYIARLVACFSYLLFYQRAVKLMPYHKNIMAFIGLLPISLMMSGAFNYDIMVMIVTINFIAVVFSIYAKDNKTSLWECAIWSFLLGAVKGGGYIILLPLVLILWDKTEKRKKIAILGIILTGIASICYFDIYLPRDMHFFQLGSSDDAFLTADYAFTNPLSYLRMCIMSYYIEGWNIFLSMMGSYLANWEFTISEWISMGLMGVMLICALFEKTNIQLSKRSCFIIWAIIIAFILVMPIMLLSHTNINSNYIQGIQGRYYLPILPLFLIVISANPSNLRKKYCQKYGDIIKYNGYYIYALFSILAVISIFSLYMNR